MSEPIARDDLGPGTVRVGTVRVGTVIVGAGFAGIAAALALKATGDDDFVILERADAVGGTWRDNVYPGVACDVPAHLYGLSSHPWPEWSRTFAPGAEIRAYLERVVASEGLDRHLRLGVAMASAAWADGGWTLSLSAGGGDPAGDLRARSLVLAAGRLTEPLIPEIPGLEAFPGPVFHSARWDESLRIHNARIAVVGTGASAIQLAPELARRGADVRLFQRTPAWIVPRRDRAYARAEQDGWRTDPASLAALRDELYAEGEDRFASRSGDPVAAAEAREVALRHLARHVPDPELRAALTPDYAFGCKRVVLSDDFYPAIASGMVTLEPSALARVEDNVLVSAGGARHEVDIVVLATGFEAARQPYARLVTGEDGISLDDHWRDGMTSVGSTLVHGFPNLFVLNGPNASLGHSSAVLIMEEQAAFAASLIARRETIRVTEDDERTYTSEIAERAAGTPWTSGTCRNWYTDPRSGRLTLLWPGTVDDFRVRLSEVRATILSPALTA